MRRHYLLYGQVQGVGLRWTARRAAELYGVGGFVRNLWDGSVELELEGSEDAIDLVILAIERGRFIHIDNLEVKDIPEQGESILRVAHD